MRRTNFYLIILIGLVVYTLFSVAELKEYVRPPISCKGEGMGPRVAIIIDRVNGVNQLIIQCTPEKRYG